MTRKDFEMIASIVRTIHDKSQRAVTALAFVERLTELNPRFDVDKFLRAADAC
jgi:hypothetical protein